MSLVTILTIEAEMMLPKHAIRTQVEHGRDIQLSALRGMHLNLKEKGATSTSAICDVDINIYSHMACACEDADYFWGFDRALDINLIGLTCDLA